MTFTPIDDSYAREGFPTGGGKGLEPEILVKTDPGLDHRSYVKFKVKGTAGTVTSALLRLYATNGSDTINIYDTGNLWGEEGGGLSWNTMPALGTLLDTQTSAAGTWVEFDVTSVVSGDGLVSLAITADNLGLKKFSTKEGTNPPELVVTTGNLTPAFTSDPFSKPNATAYQMYSNSIAADAADPDGDTLTYSKILGPDWLSIWSDGSLSGMPDSTDTGLNVFTVRVTDGSALFDDAVMNITVDAAAPPAQPSCHRPPKKDFSGRMPMPMCIKTIPPQTMA